MNDPLRRKRLGWYDLEGVWTVQEIRDSPFFAAWLAQYRERLIITNG